VYWGALKMGLSLNTQIPLLARKRSTTRSKMVRTRLTTIKLWAAAMLAGLGTKRSAVIVHMKVAAGSYSPTMALRG